jgi:hypothetical protein
VSEPETFNFIRERTEDTDAVYASIGRALALATRFENNCRMLATYFALRSGEFSLDNEDDLARLWDAISKKPLEGYITSANFALRFPRDTYRALMRGREARNRLVHDLTVGIEDALEHGVDHRDRLRELVEQIAAAETIISTVMAVQTHEPLPVASFVEDYPRQLVRWVCDLPMCRHHEVARSGSARIDADHFRRPLDADEIDLWTTGYERRPRVCGLMQPAEFRGGKIERACNGSHRHLKFGK